MLAIGKDAGGGIAGLQDIFGAVLVAGVVGFLLTPAFNRLIHFFPPVVTGSIITVIGISLLPVAVRWAGGGRCPRRLRLPANIGLAGLTLLIILLIYRFLPGFFSRIAILAGLALGTLIAWPLGMADFSRIGQAPWFAVSTPFHFGPPFEFAAILSMTIVMLVIMTETTADILAIGEIVGRPADGRTVVAACAPTPRPPRSPAACSTGSRAAPSPRTSAWWPSPGSRAGSWSPAAGSSCWRSACSRSSARSSRPSRCRSSAGPAWRCSARSPPAASER